MQHVIRDVRISSWRSATSTEPVVVDGNVITSRGVGTAIEFALKLVEILIDRQTADDLAEKIVYKR